MWTCRRELFDLLFLKVSASLWEANQLGPGLDERESLLLVHALHIFPWPSSALGQRFLLKTRLNPFRTTFRGFKLQSGTKWLLSGCFTVAVPAIYCCCFYCCCCCCRRCSRLVSRRLGMHPWHTALGSWYQSCDEMKGRGLRTILFLDMIYHMVYGVLSCLIMFYHILS